MVSTRLGLKATVGWRICATHRLPTAWERDLASSDHEAPEQLKPRLVLEQLSWKIEQLSSTSFRNLHTAINRARRQSSDLWVRAMVPLVGRAKGQVMALTW